MSSYSGRAFLPRLPSPRDNTDEEDPITNFYAEEYDYKIPRLGGRYTEWQKYNAEAPITPDQAAKELVEIYNAAVESGDVPRQSAKSGGHQRPQFSSEMAGGITVFIRTRPEESEKPVIYRYTVFTHIVYSYHVTEEK